MEETTDPTEPLLPPASRNQTRDLETQLLGGERTLRRREVAAGAGVSLLSARKIWRAMGFPNLGDDDVAFTERDKDALQTFRQAPFSNAERRDSHVGGWMQAFDKQAAYAESIAKEQAA